MDFQSLKSHLLPHVPQILTEIIPGGRLIGKEYTAGSILGGMGDSFRFNIEKSLGSDFATGQNYDIISLYAAVQNIPQIEAAKQLAQKYNWIDPSAPKETKPIPPPDATVPPMEHFKYGKPAFSWCYHDKNGKPLFYVARYETPQGKQFCPWTYHDDNSWKQKAWPTPRPLYNLHKIHANPDKSILIVEGEKAADAAQILVGDVYVVTTWTNGAQAVGRSNWDVLKNHKILIWPDNDEPGLKSAKQLQAVLSLLSPQIKTIDPTGEADGFDAADALKLGWNWDSFKTWATPRISVYNAIQASQEPPPAVSVQTVQKPAFAPIIEDNGQISGSLFSLWQDLGITLTGQNQPICNIDNAIRVFEGWPKFKGLVWFDEFYQRMVTTYNCPPNTSREWTDDDDLSLTLFMQRTMGFRRMSDEQINKAIRVYAHQNKRNEPLDWLNSLVWDKTPRIETFLIDCAGSPDTDYVRAVSRNFWISMVARAFRPGCQVDTMLILEGKQGTRKSTLLETIAGKWHASVKESIDSNNFFMAFDGKLILEFADLSTFHRSELNRLKQIITDRVDRYRSPYARSTNDHPRQCIFAGTTNDQVYLEDPTGARRFWPVKTDYINIPKVIVDRTQLFAEAVALFKSAHTWHEVPATAIEEQESRRHIDPWESKISSFIYGKYDITTADILDNCLHIETARQTRADEIRIGRILKLLGLDRKRKRFGNELHWVYNEPVPDETIVSFED